MAGLSFDSSQANRKLRKLRRDPSLFFRDMLRKRLSSALESASRPVEVAVQQKESGAKASGHPLVNPRDKPTNGPSHPLRQVALSRKQHALADAILDGIEYLEHSGHRMRYGARGAAEPMLLAYHPPGFGNPFQAVLYATAPEAKALAIPVPEIQELADIRVPGHLVFHLHWLGGVLRDAATEEEGKQRIDEFASQLDRLTRAGTRLVWTVHNILPHHARFPNLEIQVRKLVIERADAIHLLTERTTKETSTFYHIPPEKSFLCKHPSYVGVYPDYVSSDVARYQLGLHPEQKVFLFFGSIQDYKGVYELCEVFERVRNEVSRPTQLVVAGLPSDKALVKELFEAFGTSPGISLHLQKIAVEDVQYFFRAADFAVCPYKVMLNSGVAILSHSFGVPIIGPETGAIGDVVRRGGGLGYACGNAESLAAVLREATETDPREFDDALAELRAGADPALTSRKFFGLLREKLQC